jgi:hypothetical protein
MNNIFFIKSIAGTRALCSFSDLNVSCNAKHFISFQDGMECSSSHPHFKQILEAIYFHLGAYQVV